MSDFNLAIDSKPMRILLRLLEENKEVIKSSLLDIIPNSYSLERHLNDLKVHGLVNIREEKIVRRTSYVSLTEKGRAVAEQLKKAEEAARGEPIQISDDEARAWAEKFHEATKGFSLLWHVNYYEDHIAIAEEGDEKKRIINVYVKENGHGIMRLWCEEDDSFECIHVQYAWTLSEVQELYWKIVKGGK